MSIDLHCDLLGCVEDNKALNFASPETNCSVPQLRAGQLLLQTLAVAAITKRNSSNVGAKQMSLYKKLLDEYKEETSSFQKFDPKSQKTAFILAVENASALIEEDEPLDLCFKRFDNYQKIETFLYVSLTWNSENRFGGGNASSVGLKSDGKFFLDYLNGKNIAIDLSHTSDQLAYDILNTIDKKGYDINPIASHSNFRSMTNIKRNLPDELVKELVSRQGLIGLNFVRRFVGDKPTDFIKHIEHGISLGALNNLCLGCDFYGGINIPKHLLPDIQTPTFQKDFDNASKLPSFYKLIKQFFSEDVAKKIHFDNAYAFLLREKLLSLKE